jgi:ribosomal protein S18 acetylase RimI-like enzyme
VNLRAALRAYAHIFPPTAPKPTHERLAEVYRHRFTPPSRGLVLDTGRALVGCVAASVDEGGEGEVVGLYVDPSWWGQGLGVRLLDAVLEDLRAVGATSARLWVLEHNSRARGMYERRRWRADGATRIVSSGPGVEGLPEVVELRYRLAL